MGWQPQEIRFTTLAPEDFTIGPGALIPVQYVPRACVVLDRLGDEVLGELDWCWPEGDEEFLLREEITGLMAGEVVPVNGWPPDFDGCAYVVNTRTGERMKVTATPGPAMSWFEGVGWVRH